MRRMHRIVLLVTLALVMPVLAGCESFDSEKFDLFGFNEKKKLKGERKELFPEGVPGVTQGIPPEYLNKQQTSSAGEVAPGVRTPPPVVPNANPPAQPARTAAVEPEPEPKPKLKAKPKQAAKPKPKAKPAAQARTAPPQQNQQNMEPWPGQKPAQPPPPAQGQSMSTATPWPSAPPAGTFSR